MAKKHQIFISSTFSDLKAERQAAVEAILTAGHIPAGMELFAAGDESQMDVIKRWIDDSDIYMLILGGRYGSIDPISKLSYTEIEYSYALEKGKPFFSLVLNDKAIDSKAIELESKHREKDNIEKYKSFRVKVLSKISRLIDDCKDIKIGVLESIRQLEGRVSLQGWVRSDSMPNVSPLLNQLSALTNENNEMKSKLKNVPVYYIDEDTPIASLEDSISLSITYKLKYGDREKVLNVKLTWAEIFGLIAPKLLSIQSDDNIKHYIGNQVVFLNEGEHYSQSLNEQNFQTIKIHLMALNLIEINSATGVPFWGLTDLGRKILLKLRSVKKPAEHIEKSTP